MENSGEEQGIKYQEVEGYLTKLENTGFLFYNFSWQCLEEVLEETDDEQSILLIALGPYTTEYKENGYDNEFTFVIHFTRHDVYYEFNGVSSERYTSDEWSFYRVTPYQVTVTRYK